MCADLQRLAAYVFAVLFGVGLHLLLTVSIAGSEVRVGSTDIILPVALILITCLVLLGKWYPQYKIKGVPYWFLILTFWLLMSLVTGYFYTGEFQRWALVNKNIGWFVLVGYFICGSWLGSQSEEKVLLFLRCLFAMTFAGSLYSLISTWLILYNHTPFFPFEGAGVRAEGFSDNPNAFGIMIACMFVMHLPFLGSGKLGGIKTGYILSAVLLVCVYYSLSRSAWLGLSISLIGVLLLSKSCWKGLLISAVLGFSINYVFFELPSEVDFGKYKEIIAKNKRKIQKEMIADKNTNTSTEQENIVVKKTEKLKKNYGYKTLIDNRTTKAKDYTVNIRVEMFKKSFQYWLEQPIIGIGLGSYKWRSEKENVSVHSYHIHNTGIWLLAETGLIGLLLFATFFILIFIAFIRSSKANNNIAIGTAGLLLVMLGASAGTEILYQRYLWFILGLALVNGGIENES